MSVGATFLDRLRNAGISPTDSETLRLQKSLLFFATGLISLASMVWLSIYWQLGPRFSSNLPFALQLLLVGNLLVYLKTLNFNVFRLLQLSLFLFTLSSPSGALAASSPPVASASGPCWRRSARCCSSGHASPVRGFSPTSS